MNMLKALWYGLCHPIVAGKLLWRNWYHRLVLSHWRSLIEEKGFAGLPRTNLPKHFAAFVRELFDVSEVYITHILDDPKDVTNSILVRTSVPEIRWLIHFLGTETYYVLNQEWEVVPVREFVLAVAVRRGMSREDVAAWYPLMEEHEGTQTLVKQYQA